MRVKDIFRRLISYFLPIKLKTYHSQYSGELFIYLVNGKKVLDTESVNYSFNSLHKVFKKAFRETSIDPHVGNVLVLGLGAGSIIDILRSDYLVKAPITAVDIDPVIVNIARSEFNLNRYQPIQVITADAYEWINENTKGYDIICVDLFINAEVPSAFLNTLFIDQLLRTATVQATIYFNVMLVNSKVNSLFDHIYNYLLKIKEDGFVHYVNYIEVEENNRVLIIKK